MNFLQPLLPHFNKAITIPIPVPSSFLYFQLKFQGQIRVKFKGQTWSPSKPSKKRKQSDKEKLWQNVISQHQHISRVITPSIVRTLVVSYTIDIVSDDYDVTHSEDALSRVAWIANRSYRARPEFVFINIFIANPPPHSHQLPSDSNRLGYLTLYLLEELINKESFSLLQTVLPSSCDLNNSLWREAVSYTHLTLPTKRIV